MCYGLVCSYNMQEIEPYALEDEGKFWSLKICKQNFINPYSFQKIPFHLLQTCKIIPNSKIPHHPSQIRGTKIYGNSKSMLVAS